MMMDETGMDQLERHEQSVRRVRLVCEMHRVPTGATRNLDELIAAVKEDRHFAMDFWALVGDLSARERGTLSDEEMLDVIVEASSGAETGFIPHELRRKVEELRHLLAGVDVGRPADLPEPITGPQDALLSVYRDRETPRYARPAAPVVRLPDRTAGTMRVGARVRVTGSDDTWVARRSIGEALSRLEKTSTELREQLAAIDEQLVEQTNNAAVAPEPQEVVPERQEIKPEPQKIVPELQKIVPEPHEIVAEPKKIVSESHEKLRERQETVRNEKHISTQAAEAIAAREILMRALESHKEPHEAVADPVRATWPRNAASPDTSAETETDRTWKIKEARTQTTSQHQKEVEREAEVFPPRPAHTLSQRGLATPRKDDGPSVSVPLSRYAREGSRQGGRSITVAAVLLVMLALAGGGAFFVGRTESGQDTLAKLRPALREQYDGIVERLGALKREASGGNSSATSESVPIVKPAPEAKTANAKPQPKANRSSPAVASRAGQTAPVIPPTNADVIPQKNEVPTAGANAPTRLAATPTEPPAERKDRETVAARSRSVDTPKEPTGEGLVADAGAVKVAPSVMEANLVTSRVPAYPDSAKAEGIQGAVVMEAVISKSGTVDHVRVIEGDSQLRSAAEEAVLKWRYRPYLVNGQPVDVATVVRVDFRLGRGYGR
jgi:TonB family protein